MTAWLTPDVEQLTNPLDCRTISVPGDFWLYIQGALGELGKDYRWEQFGTASPGQMAQFFRDVLDGFSDSECGGGGMVFMPGGGSYPLLLDEGYASNTTYDVEVDVYGLYPQTVGAKSVLLEGRFLRDCNIVIKGTAVYPLPQLVVDHNPATMPNGQTWFQRHVPLTQDGKILVTHIHLSAAQSRVRINLMGYQ